MERNLSGFIHRKKYELKNKKGMYATQKGRHTGNHVV